MKNKSKFYNKFILKNGKTLGYSDSNNLELVILPTYSYFNITGNEDVDTFHIVYC